MCTLSIIPYNVDPGRRPAACVRIACNRDESRLRPAATPPELTRLAGRQALMPIDPVGLGTWIAASNVPLALALMNVYAAPFGSNPQSIAPRRAPPVSRGTIIPHVLPAGSLGEALARARDLDLAQFEPFRLVIADRDQFAEVVWWGGRFEVSDPAAIRGPLFFTSSGLGDEVVAGPRRTLFDELFAADADWPAAQDAFHRHVWPGKEYASVWMTRPEARTVSLTVVELLRQDVRMSYYARENDGSDARDSRSASVPIARGQADVTS
ncbi:MAG: hypothetical protein WD063_20745 [Pirellulales bacterium]